MLPNKLEWVILFIVIILSAVHLNFNILIYFYFYFYFLKYILSECYGFKYEKNLFSA